jgi:murein DD-endopeptidase MepM/ murein hydrolase activator NlpD
MSLPEPHRGVTLDMARATLRGGPYAYDHQPPEWWRYYLQPGEVAITNLYGPRPQVQDPDTGVWSSPFHRGWDTGSNPGVGGTQLYAMWDGDVIESKYDPESAGGYGNTIMVADLSGLWAFRYAHMEQLSPFGVGARVTIDDVLGTEGETGLADGQHLHFEILQMVAGQWWPVDPGPFLASLRDVGEAPPPPVIPYPEGQPVPPLTDIQSLELQYVMRRPAIVWPQTYERLPLPADLYVLGREPRNYPQGTPAAKYELWTIEE